MAVRKEFRDLTVSDFYRSGKSVPMIRVSGLWLEELGFNVGDGWKAIVLFRNTWNVV